MSDSSDNNDIVDEDTRMISISSVPAVILPDGSEPVQMGSGVVTSILGEGGMAVVYEIWNEQLGVKRAVKLLRPNSSEENLDRFNKEVKITAQLDHPNIIDIHGVGVWNGLPYIEMEMIDGISLAELIHKQDGLPLEICVAISIIICRSLNYTHHHEYVIDNKHFKGVLHSDLKPGNILISKDGIVRLTDFGIATPTNIATNTSSGKVLGSMQYLAPEQLEEEDVDARADIFSFGCIVYEMLTGMRTFPYRNVTRLIRKRLKNEFKPISAFDISIPKKLVSIVNQCLRLNVNKRPSDIRIVLRELEKIHSSISFGEPEETIVAYIKGEKETSKRDIIFAPVKKLSMQKTAGIALLILSLSALVIYFLMSNPLEKVPSYNNKKYVSDDTRQGSIEYENGISSYEEKSQTVEDAPKAEIEELPDSKVKKASIERDTKQKKPVKKIKQKVVKQSKKIVPNKSKPIAKKKPKALLGKLQAKYHTKDFISIMKREDAVKHYKNVLKIFRELPLAQARLKEVQLFRHRALLGTGRINKSYFDNNHINDGEFYLSKAEYLYSINQYQRAVWILSIIKTAPTVLINKRVLNKKVLYYTALCYTGMFNNNPLLKNKKKAMQSWFDVKNVFRNSQNHPYFKKANNKIREINKTKVES